MERCGINEADRKRATRLRKYWEKRLEELGKHSRKAEAHKKDQRATV